MPSAIAMLLSSSRKVNASGSSLLAICSALLGIGETYRLNCPHVTDQGLLRSVVPSPILAEVDTRRPVSESLRIVQRSPPTTKPENPHSLVLLLIAQKWTGMSTASHVADFFAETTCAWSSTPCFRRAYSSNQGTLNSLPSVVTSEESSHKTLRRVSRLTQGNLRGAIITRDPRDGVVCNASRESRRELAEAVRVAEESNGPAKNLTLVRLEDLSSSPKSTCASLASALGLASDPARAWQSACQSAVERTSRTPSTVNAKCWGAVEAPEHTHVPSELTTKLAAGLGYTTPKATATATATAGA